MEARFRFRGAHILDMHKQLNALSAMTQAPPQSATNAEAFLSSVVREALSTDESAAQGSGGAFEHLEALTQELTRCAGAALASLRFPSEQPCVVACGLNWWSARRVFALT